GHNANAGEMPLIPASKAFKIGAAILVLFLVATPEIFSGFPYLTVLLNDILIASLFATSLYFIMGPGGMHSFGHA
ncbi:MAG TPA: ABC transporter permease, partial [Pusillimonas sp.]|nr:ABC transporter permease [Pusillimonas sp.]